MFDVYSEKELIFEVQLGIDLVFNIPLKLVRNVITSKHRGKQLSNAFLRPRKWNEWKHFV